ncbi:FeoA family protein [Dendrosporobacter sp. 1207_IL3150]|uniref:FeoA family protein n=1 Tax=Dendrosporobacter sp. 1207_IL3150 TaxID=3084054 RepID=UPI002FD9E255
MNSKSEVIALSSLAAGECCWVAAIEIHGLLRRRILDMGMVPGTTVECIRRSPSGDPIAYKVRDSIIALRHDDASNIKVFTSNN